MRKPWCSSAHSVLVFALLSSSLVGGTSALAADADWPCPQALVPQVSAAMLWDGPSIDGVDWRGNPRAAALVAALTPASIKAEAAQERIASAVQGLSTEEKDRLLTATFAGVLEQLNHDRSRLISGIERYSRDQAQRAEAVGKALDELAGLERDPATAAQARAESMRKELQMQERIFDERERSIRYLCLRPVAVEERLGVLARALASHLGE